jgi:hypothetical protein
MKFILFCLTILFLTATSAAEIRFVDVTESAGIRFQHNNGAFGKKYLPETMGSGGAFLDYDNDGWLDIFLLNGMDWPGQKKKQKSLPALYRNNRDGSFTDVTQNSGLALTIYGMGAAAADYDNDGDMDLYITALAADRLFQNQGNGTFKDVTDSSGLGNPDFGSSAAFLDYDRDGWLDLFVANYVHWSRDTDIFCSLDGETKSYCTPQAYQGATPRLYRNLGNGRFQETTEKAGLLDNSNKGLGVLVFDYNNDTWPDIMLANDTQPNKLWENKHDGTFEEVGVLAGIAFSEDGVARGAMGIDAGDYDRSGYESVLIGNFSNEMLSLYHNEEGIFFIDDAPTSNLGISSLLTLTFGCFFIDYNLDGFLDIFTANGHVENDINSVQEKVFYKQPPHLFQNLDGRRFKEVTQELGKEFAAPRVSRGAAYGDFDNDGDLDILVTTCGESPRLFRNDGGNQNNWITLKLVGEKSNRNGIGARVTIQANGVRQSGYVRSGGSYCSQSQLRQTFGLGKSKKVESVQILWPSGEVQQIKNVSVNQFLEIRESANQAESLDLGVRISD